MKKYLLLSQLILLLLGSYFPRFNSVDIIGPQWFYLSIVNFLIFLEISFSNSSVYIEMLKKFREIKFFLAFIIFSFISISSAINKSEAYITSINYFILFVSFLHFNTILYLLQNQNIKFSLKKLVSFLLVIELIDPLLYLIPDALNGSIDFGAKRYYGLAYNINILAFSLSIKIPLLIYFLKKELGKFRHLLLLIYIFLILLLFVLGTRSATYSLLIIILSVLVYNIFCIKNRKISFYIKVLIPIIFAPAILTLSTETISEKIISNAKSIISENDSSINYRINFYKHAINSIKKNPLQGIGVGNWKLFSIEYDKENLEEYTVPYHAHNDFLQITAESGILAGVSYILIFLSYLFGSINKFLVNKSYKILYFSILPIFIFFVDSSLNFPIARPISMLFILFLISYNNNFKGYEEII